jgi:hypothetical protein
MPKTDKNVKKKSPILKNTGELFNWWFLMISFDAVKYGIWIFLLANRRTSGIKGTCPPFIFEFFTWIYTQDIEDFEC